MRVLPVIPEKITIHLGSPNSDAMNVTETFPNYIKNVASSEIYPNWPEEAIKANVLAQISVALNRVYTEHYRNMGKDFDITSSPAYDQTYVFQRDIFENISKIVDELFNSYIKRDGSIEPLFAQFCDGIEVECNGLSQWGSLNLAQQGLTYEQILRRYYGADISIVTDVPIENIEGTAPKIPFSEGDSGRNVELIQIKLNRISKNFPGIPKIFPVDGFFDTSTTNAVRKFQEVFNLTPDGIVGSATWYKINLVYNSVKELSEITSEGLKLNEVQTQYRGLLQEGDSGNDVFVLQYYLAYISLFVPSVSYIKADGDFGANTKNSVLSFQKTYGLLQTGIVDELTWDSIENTYFGILKTIPYEFQSGVILPFPGRVLRIGTEGDDVRALQEYLNYISNTYTEIPKITVDGVYGPGTANAVNKFIQIFGISSSPDRVNAVVWNSIISVYDDLYQGNIVNENQFPGYGIS